MAESSLPIPLPEEEFAPVVAIYFTLPPDLSISLSNIAEACYLSVLDLPSENEKKVLTFALGRILRGNHKI